MTNIEPTKCLHIPVDDYKSLEQQLQTLTAQVAVLREALTELVDLKQWKDTIGKDHNYRERQPKAWEQAKEALAELSQ